MATPIIFPPTQDALQKTLSASLLTGVTASATLNNVTGIQNLKGLMVIDRVDANNNLTPNKREYITFAGTSGSTVITLVRGLAGSTDQDHAVGAIVELVNDVVQQQAIIDGLSLTVNADGTARKAIGTDINTGTEDAEFVTPKAIADSTILKSNLTGMVTSSGSVTTLNAPQGFLINGKIVPSVTSNNLTVAIKGMDGNDPSASNPVYCRIGNTIQTITAALSVTVNAGTNYFGCGSAELATKEVDYFVYLLVHGSTIGVSFSRIPYARLGSDFYLVDDLKQNSAPQTISLAATDEVELIGRFAATLSAGAGYTWTVPTFTATNLIQRPIYETRILSIAPQFTVAEFDNASGGQPTTTSANYQVVGHQVLLQWSGAGTKAGTNNYISITRTPFIPITATSIPTGSFYYRVGGVELTGISIDIASKFYMFASASIADNASMTIAGFNVLFQI